MRALRHFASFFALEASFRMTCDQADVRGNGNTLLRHFFALARFVNVHPHVHLGIRHWDKQDGLNLLVMLAFVSYVHRQFVMDDGERVQMLENHWGYIPYISMLQILRNPTQLRSWLRPLRVAFGPTSILAVVVLAAETVRVAETPATAKATAAVAGLCSLMAGFVLRPDNFCLLKLLVPLDKISSMQVRKWHGLLNISANVVLSLATKTLINL
jgi:hypothetical protein